MLDEACKIIKHPDIFIAAVQSFLFHEVGFESKWNGAKSPWLVESIRFKWLDDPTCAEVVFAGKSGQYLKAVWRSGKLARLVPAAAIL